MQVRILGAHQGESRDLRFMSLLIDEHLAIDAGGLTTSLTREEQLNLEAVLITHRHYDHVKDLPGLAHTMWETKDLQLYCIADVRDALQAHMFNGVLWPALRKREQGYYAVVFNEVQPGKAFDLLGYTISPVTMSHTVPTVGYCVARDGRSVFYTADTRGTGDPSWGEIRPDVLIVETTMDSADDERASHFGHMSPASLERELRAFHARQGYFPRTFCVHMNPNHEPKISTEIADLAAHLGAEITLASEGLVIEV